MGYNTWDDFRCGGINASNLYKVADAMVDLGLNKLGYKYLSLDDCWATGRDPKSGVIIPDSKAFPDGMKAVADYVHGKGLLYGVYTDRGQKTCVGRPGSQDYETIDAKTYASWGVDYLKEDSCNATGDHNASFAQYAKMRDALNATGRPIYFDLCGWSSWYAPVGKSLGNAWRVGYDVNNWGGVMNNAIAVDKSLAQYAGPGGWNDIDALIGSDDSPRAHGGTAVHLTQTQSRTQFNLWCMLSAQLIIGGNVLHMTKWDLETYSNKALIAINQDASGKQAKLVMQTSQASPTPYDPWLQQVWLKGPLSTGEYAIAFVNTTNTTKQPRSPSLGLGGSHLALANCNSSDPAQQWNVTTDPSQKLSLISSHASTDVPALKAPACLEVNGCNYSPGAHVDTNFGCKKFPKPGSTDPCASNMAWRLTPAVDHPPATVGPGSAREAKASAVAADGAGGPVVISTGFKPELKLCLEVLGGGSLAPCDGSRSQQWTITGDVGAQQLKNGAGFGCLSNGGPNAAPSSLTFDVTGLGWKTATTTDVWTGKVRTGSKVTVALPEGNGASQVFLLKKAS
jgi:alpha-galactosidase